VKLDLPKVEPVIAVGLVEDSESVSFRLSGEFEDGSGASFPSGDYCVECREGVLRLTGAHSAESRELVLQPEDEAEARFSLEATIGIDFHWQQKEQQSFSGGLRFKLTSDDRLTVINDVPLEAYLTSVICSEMDASSPLELIKAHSVVSRSWLLAQRKEPASKTNDGAHTIEREGERIRWYDREAHRDFVVCADDHCQRYHGVGRIKSADALQAVRETRGQVLTYDGKLCDARYGKCCGGVTEAFDVAWADEEVPYLVPLWDGPGEIARLPDLVHDDALREFIRNPPDVFCNCNDEQILGAILTPHDRETRDFFRWKVRLSASEVADLLRNKLGADLGRILALEPVERGRSGRLKLLRWVGEKRSLVIGKELEIRRALSESHLYSSAFVVDVEGPADRPDGFVLKGAGWGHGVGLCQIGAAVMAWRDTRYEAILSHYYPGSSMERLYE
jgi:peptidoglycan hydrolase-like amidase